MKLGFVSAILAEESLDEVIEFASSQKYDCIEIMCWPPGKADRRYAGVTHVDVVNLNQETADQILEKFSARNVEVSGLGYYPNPLVADHTEAETYITHLRRVIEAAPKLGVDVVNTFIGRDPTKSVDDNWPRFLEVWKPLIRHAEEHGVRVAIENCPMFFSDDEWPSGKNLAISPNIWRRMFEAIPSDHFGLNYDPSHFLWQQMDYVKPIREFASKIFHVHAKDATIRRDDLDNAGILANPLEFHTPKLPGLGDIRWGSFFSALAEVGYVGPVCVEVEDRPYERTSAGRRGSLRQSHRYLRQFMSRGLAG